MYPLSLLFLVVNCSCQKSIGVAKRAYNPLTHRINWPLALSPFGSTFDSIKNSQGVFLSPAFHDQGSSMIPWCDWRPEALAVPMTGAMPKS